MCRIACEEGISMASATAHQNERWSSVTPDAIRHGTAKLSQMLREAEIPLTVFPCAEVMVHPGIEESWRRNEVLTVADRGQYMLVEMPDGLFVDLRQIAHDLRRAGIRPILAHPERHAELLHETGRIEELIHAGCLVQVSSNSVTDPRTRADGQALKGWFKRGVVHLVASDAHSPRRRAPRMAEACCRIAQWAGAGTADRVCSTNGMAILQGFPLRVPPTTPARKRWLSVFWALRQIC